MVPSPDFYVLHLHLCIPDHSMSPNFLAQKQWPLKKEIKKKRIQKRPGKKKNHSGLFLIGKKKSMSAYIDMILLSLPTKKEMFWLQIGDLFSFPYILYFYTSDLSQKGQRNRRYFWLKSISCPKDTTAMGTLYHLFRNGSVASAPTQRPGISRSLINLLLWLWDKKEPNEL